MKRLLFILFIISYANSSFGQNWSLIQPNDQYYYGSLPYYSCSFPLIPGNNPVTASAAAGAIDSTFAISIDSSINVAGDLVHLYKKRYAACDTCPYPILKEITPLDPAYLFPQIISKSTGGHYMIIINDTLEIAANPTATSIIDSIHQIHVFTDSVFYGNWLWGAIQDSVLSITAKSLIAPFPLLYKVHLSKNHGIVRLFKYDAQSQQEELLFEQIGKQGQNSVGYPTLKFADIYNFNIGDQFYYYVDLFDANGLSFTWDIYASYYYRLKVLNRLDVSSDTIIYTMERVGYNSSPSHSPFLQNVPDTITITYTDSENNLYNLQEGELQQYPSNQNSYVGCKDFFNVEAMKYIGYDFNATPYQSGPNWTIDNYVSHFGINDSLDYQGNHEGSVFDIALLYQAGLGKTYSGEWYFESYREQEMIGYIKNGIATGNTPNITFLNNPNIENKSSFELNILKNPVSSSLEITYKNSIPQGEISFIIYNFQGQVIQSFTRPTSSAALYSFPIHNLSSGAYSISVYPKGQSPKSLKFIVKK